MTLLGWILFIVFVLSIVALLNEGAKDALRIDQWSDLWNKKA